MHMNREIHPHPARPFTFARLSVLVFLLAIALPTAHGDEPASEAKDAGTIDIAAVYKQQCERCHGADGQGVADGDVKPFQADQSLEKLTKLITETMPDDDPESCVGDDAVRLAKYILEHFQPGASVDDVPRISRLTVDQYRNAVADVIGRFAPQELSDDGDGGRRSRSRSRNGEVPGLRGEYYQSSGMNKADRLGHYRSDTRMEFDFGDSSPVPSISADQFAIIWQGSLSAEHTGYYEFRVTTENGARLYLNFDPQPSRGALRDDSSQSGHQALIDAWVGSGELRQRSARIFLLGGRTYPIRLEFFKYLEDDASVMLEWKPPQATWSVLDYNHTMTAESQRVFVCDTPFPADDRSLGYERGSSVSPQWQAATMNGAIEAAAEVVARLPLLAKLDEADDRPQRIKEFIWELARVAYRRPLSDVERQVLTEIVAADANNLEAGVRRAVVMVLMSPHFLYPDLTPAGEKPSPYVVASRLSFALWDSIPDADLFEAALSGRLESSEEIESYARRLLRDPRTKAKMRSFFRSWLEIEERDLSKDKALFPGFDEAVIADLRRSLELFIDDVVWSRDSDYRQLLLADYLMLNDRLAELYQDEAAESDGKLDGEEIKRRARRLQFASEFQPVDFPPEKRSGVLTHPYLLSAYAYHNNTSPIHRGVFLTRNIVGRALSPPPIAVAFKDDEFSPDLTMREKITQLTRDTACMSCHSVINPLGFTLENFDAVGRWRESDNQKPVDTKTEYITVDGETIHLARARDVANFAVKQPSAHGAFIAHVYEHLVKRSPHDEGPELLDRLRNQFADDDFNIQNLWARIALAAAVQDMTATPNLLSKSSP